MTMTVIEDKIGEVVASMRNLSAKDAEKFGITAGLTSPYYFFGHPLSINSQMINRDAGSNKGKVYPAVALRLPVVEEIKNGLINYSLNIAIFAETDKQKSDPERLETVIKPILIPLYLLFLDRLKKAGFMWPNDMGIPPHQKINRPHHGITAEEGPRAYEFNQPLDGIELQNLRINYIFKTC